MPVDPNQQPFEIGDFDVDPGLGTLAPRGGPAETLEPKLLQVLELLARHAGETVSVEALLAEVWGGKFVGEAVVTRAISELRRFLGDDAKAPRYIQTVPRRGYRLIADVGPSPAKPVVPSGRAAGLATTSGGRPGEGRRTTWLLLAILGAVIALALVFRSRDQATGASAEAFRLYAQAQVALSGGSCVAHQAIRDLERALELAPTFAPAWEQYGWAKYNLVSSCGESGGAYVEATRAADRALELEPGSTQALALKLAVLTETGHAEEAYRLASERAADAPQIAFLAAYAATYGGALEVAVERIEGVARRDPAFFVREGWTPNALLYLGREARFLEFLPQGSSPLARFYRGYARHRSGDSRAALADLTPAFSERPSDPFARLAEALVAVIENRDQEARLLLSQLALQRTRLAATDGEFTFRVAALLAEAGDPEATLREIERAVSQGFFCSRCLEREPSLRSLASDPRFAAQVARARQRERAFPATTAQ